MPQRKSYEPYYVWLCCQCPEGLQSVSLNTHCSNAQCQHMRCEACGINGGGYWQLNGASSPQCENVPTLQGRELERLHILSERRDEKLAEINQLKAIHKTTFEEAVKLHEQEQVDLPVDRDRSVLERYLLDLIQPTEFVFAWEWSILPFLVDLLPEWLGSGFAINVSRDPRHEVDQTICFTSRLKQSRARRMIIARHVLDVIPERFQKRTAFEFYWGTVDFLNRGSGKNDPDDVCDARNPYFYLLPMMGDSIGPAGDDCAGTLGPCVVFGNKSYWLANLHIFLKRMKPGDPYVRQNSVLHPGLLDCCEHPIIQKKYVKFGTLNAYSGDDLTTTRTSSHPYWRKIPKADVVTDWVLIEDLGITEESSVKKLEPFLNTLRVPGIETIDSFAKVTKIAQVLPEAKAHTTGRTSGYQCGQIAEIPAYIHAGRKGRSRMKATREWFIEQPSWISGSEGDWLEGGIGVPGDSGAPVIDSDNNSLYGQIWGRNKYWGEGPRIVYFTSIFDISDDIRDRYPQLKEPLGLPQSCSRERKIESELYCPECYAKLNTPSSSDGMSMMSISSDDAFDSRITNEEQTAGADFLDLEHSSTTQSDTGSNMSVDPDHAIVSFSPIDRDGFDDLHDVLPTASDPDVALAMALDPFQYYGNVDHNLGINDDTLSIDDDVASDEMEFIGRSCARGRKSQNGLAREKSLDTWVMICGKSTKPATDPTTRVRKARKTRPSLLDLLLETTELMTGLAIT